MRQGAIVVGLVLVACTAPMPVGPASGLQTPSGPSGGSGSSGSSSGGADADCRADGDAACPHARVGDGAGDDGTAGPRCGTDSDCGPNYACAYLVDASCTAAGVCVSVAPCGGAGRQPTYCGCDGGAFLRRCDLPLGYSQAPVLSGAYPPCGSWDAGPTGDAADASAE